LEVLRTSSKVNLTNKGKEWIANGFTGWSKAAKFNAMNRFREQEILWTLAKEKEIKTGQNYTHMMVFFDDSNWIFDFDLNLLLATDGRVKIDGAAGHVYGVKCEKQYSTIGDDVTWVLDFVFLAERSAAEPFGSLYTVITDPKSMHKQPPLDSNAVMSVEQYYYRTMKAFNIQFETVPARLFPFQRCGRMMLMNKSTHKTEEITCLHYRCDSSFLGIPPLNPRKYVSVDCVNVDAGNVVQGAVAA